MNRRVYSVPMLGVHCGRCGQAAEKLIVGPHSRVITHLNHNLPDCPDLNPAEPEKEKARPVAGGWS